MKAVLRFRHFGRERYALVSRYGHTASGREGEPLVTHGEGRPTAKLTFDLVEALRQMNEAGIGYRRLRAWLEDEHGIVVQRSLIQQICTYRRWTGPPPYKRPKD